MKADELIDRYLTERLTRGIRNALERNGGVKVCVGCSLMVPKYPGRYPQRCPECSKELEDFQNAPRYFESFDESHRQDVVDFYLQQAKEQGLDFDIVRNVRQKQDRQAMSAPMRRIPQDRYPPGPTPYYEL